MALTTDALLQSLSDHVLAHGLQTASLRPLAKAAGTSDRMLIYHFGSKEALVDDVLHYIADRMAHDLTALLTDQRSRSAGALLENLWQAAQSETMRPTMRIWLELVAIASREGGAKANVADQIVTGFLDWTAAHLTDPEDAPFVLTQFEGLLVLQEAGHAATAATGLKRLREKLG
ncbi:TetR/AcrR family transcriptional regulator [Yoonia sp. 208BN28-4]|uniref:TetR/AcrR family transcriptional regulator n=1 Tax=Yoonia sp. 208BN28-4 TaxID=3126505 RepID=UPI0030AB4B6C